MNLNSIAISLSIIGSTITLIKLIGCPILKILKLQEKQAAGIRCLLRKEIYEIVNRARNRSFIFKEEVIELRKLFINYKELDGNGIIDKMVDTALKLPVKKPTERG